MHELDRLGMSRVMEMAIDIASNDTDGVHLSLDLDGLDLITRRELGHRFREESPSARATLRWSCFRLQVVSSVPNSLK